MKLLTYEGQGVAYLGESGLFSYNMRMAFIGSAKSSLEAKGAVLLLRVYDPVQGREYSEWEYNGSTILVEEWYDTYGKVFLALLWAGVRKEE
ncbi:MAG: hypothetical protein KatS3mg054_0036 [Chloroflexus sp.]|nr:MAG: hypothetical protein KatS3mg054_0036 [Chloroflexus sp.]